MAAQDLLRNKVTETPTIYAYEHLGVPGHKGWLKVGYTTRDAPCPPLGKRCPGQC